MKWYQLLVLFCWTSFVLVLGYLIKHSIKGHNKPQLYVYLTEILRAKRSKHFPSFESFLCKFLCSLGCLTVFSRDLTSLESYIENPISHRLLSCFAKKEKKKKLLYCHTLYFYFWPIMLLISKETHKRL